MARRTTVTLDDAILRAAQEALGTTGVQDTIDRALDEVIRAQRRRAFAEAVRDGSAFDFTEGALDRATHWRVQ